MVRRIMIAAAVSLSMVSAVLFAAFAGALEDQTPSFDFLVRANQRDVWTAPYDTHLDQYDTDLGWVSGDRWGYRCMFTFLEYDGALVARVTFAALPESSAYTVMQTRNGFIEGNRYYDGTLNTSGSHQTGGPEDCIQPGPYDPFEGDPGPLPLITFSDAADGRVLEVRDYAAAAPNAAPDAEFRIASATPSLVVVVAYQAGVPVAAVYYELMPGVTNVDLTSNFDTTPPDTLIDSGPSGTTDSAGADFSFSATEPGSTFECSLDGAAFAGCTSPQAYADLAEGEHTFQVRATDEAGNTDPTPASQSWIVDLLPADCAFLEGETESGHQVSATVCI